ncbi:MAG: hypothetical protein Q9192_006339 [Flavoplaca navasiana]
METVKQYERHVARHMEELALFVLPRSGPDDEEQERNSDSCGTSATESDENIPLIGTDEWLESMKHHVDITEDDQDEIFGPPEIDQYTIIKGKIGGTDRLKGVTIYSLEFVAGSIWNADITVGEIKLDAYRQLSQVSTTIRSLTPGSLEYHFEGQMLENNALSARDAGIEHGAVILAKVRPDEI